MYGINKKVPFSEEDRLEGMVSPYAVTKRIGEELCYVYHHLFAINIFCLRFFTVYGPRQRPEMAIHKFTRLIEGGQRVPLYGDGTSSRDYTYIDDIIDGIMRAIERVRGFEIFNLGEAKTITLQQLISLIEGALGKKAQVDRLPPQPGDVPQTYADISKARRLLGYNPQVGVEEGIRRFVSWFRSHSSSSSGSGS